MKYHAAMTNAPEGRLFFFFFAHSKRPMAKLRLQRVGWLVKRNMLLVIWKSRSFSDFCSSARIWCRRIRSHYMLTSIAWQVYEVLTEPRMASDTKVYASEDHMQFLTMTANCLPQRNRKDHSVKTLAVMISHFALGHFYTCPIDRDTLPLILVQHKWVIVNSSQ